MGCAQSEAGLGAALTEDKPSWRCQAVRVSGQIIHGVQEVRWALGRPQLSGRGPGTEPRVPRAETQIERNLHRSWRKSERLEKHSGWGGLFSV